jgi:hypothetical protein
VKELDRVLRAVSDVRWRLGRTYLQVERLERDLLFLLKETA